jgi:FKBP-type peptidyl-prolyl cis-trans isomerase (trigger factor)
MNEHESDKQPTAAPEGGETPVNQSAAETATEPATVESTYVPTEQPKKEKSKTGMYIAAIVIVAVTLLTVLFMLEREGRSSTGVFDSYFAAQESSVVVAVVNGEEITGKDLNTSIQQFNQAAVAQGVDTSSPEVIADIRTQALDVLVNTTLLKQAAQEQGVEVSAEATAERLDAIQADIGGAEALQARIAELGLTQADLEEDINEELVIQALLNTLFAEAEIDVTDQEIQEVYDAAGGAGEELPPLEEVSDQIETQVRGSKEQEVIEEYLGTLRTDAAIELI